MVDLKELNLAIDESGMTLPVIADRAGIPYRSLKNKVEGKTPFKAEDIVGVSSALRLTNKRRDNIFLIKSVDYIDRKEQ